MNEFATKFLNMKNSFAAANAGTQSFNADGLGGGLGASSANAGGKLKAFSAR